jgi:arsenical pump membrane protein
VSEALAVVALLAALGAAIARDRRAPEAVVALGGAAVLVLVGAISWHGARTEAGDLAPTLVVLTALLVLGEGCERAGLFDALAARIAAGARGSGVRLLALVFAAAVAVTAVLGLDATVVLLTPAAFAAAARARLPGRPPVYACTHLANSASLLLPISNLTNLLAFRETHLSFAHFAALMALPWAVAIAVEWAGFRYAFAGDLRARGAVAPGAGEAAREAARPAAPLPRPPLVVLALTLAGFVVASPLGVDTAWPAAAGAVAMVAVQREAWRGVDLPLAGFVLGLGVIVAALAEHGLGDLVDAALPAGHGLLALLAATALAAVLANLLNNLPALLVLLPAAAAAGTPTVLAVLIGVNAGPNLTYAGSLATLLWRRVLRARDAEPSHRDFHVLGALTVPPVLIGATIALWLVT